MSTISSLNISVKATTDQFEKAMNKANRVLGEFASKALEFGGGQLLADGLERAAEALGEFVKQEFEAIDKSAKLADALGTDIQSLRGLEFAGKIAGASAETVDQALKKLAHSTGEAINGNAEMQASFTDLGIDLKQFGKLDAVSQFKELSKAIGALGTPSEKAAVAVKFFGKSAVDILTLINSNVDETQDRFNSLAPAIDRVDAAKVELANEAMVELKTAVIGVADRIAVELAPYIIGAAKAVLEFANVGTDGTSAVSQGFAAVRSILTDVVDALNFVSAAVKLVVAGFLKLFEVSQKINHFINPLSNLTDKLIGSLIGVEDTGKLAGDAAGEVFNSALDSYQKFKDGVTGKELNSGLDKWKKDADEAAKKLKDLADVRKAAQAAVDVEVKSKDKEKKDNSLKEAAKALEKMQAEIKRTTEEFDPFAKFKDRIKELSEQLKAGLDPAIFKKAAQAAAEILDKATQTTKTGVGAVGSIKQVDSSLIDVKGLSRAGKDQIVHSPQFEKANQLLKQLVDQGSPVPVAG